MKPLSNIQGDGYFEELPESTKTIVHDAIIACASNRRGPDCWKSHEEAIESIECKSRSGFIPHSWNHGGIDYNNFTTLSDYWSGGYSVAHEKANAEIERQIEYSLECALESFFSAHSEELSKLGITKTNHELYDERNQDMLDKYYEYEHENLNDDQSSIMHSIRFMYHGIEDGIHSASVSCAVNTEGPYHRSSISWAPNVFCEGAHEVEITWRNDNGLKTKLTKALKECSGKVF